MSQTPFGGGGIFAAERVRAFSTRSVGEIEF
jgi:hypothetical protein